ncbi:hypothetical protein BY458DRAFT_553391 [Sporodiniella umbellata]|nr:hypothetical protein BY458DRAFT_553391 [Sporodiniella umbellata]
MNQEYACNFDSFVSTPFVDEYIDYTFDENMVFSTEPSAMDVIQDKNNYNNREFFNQAVPHHLSQNKIYNNNTAELMLMSAQPNQRDTREDNLEVSLLENYGYNSGSNIPSIAPAPMSCTPNYQLSNPPPASVNASNSIPNSSYAAVGKAMVVFQPKCMESMMYEWSRHEAVAGRRIVHFKSVTTQVDPTIPLRKIEVDCEPFIDLGVYQLPPGECLISCIYYKQQEDFFITSTDIIRLLESVLSVEFTKEEKNRMRRNIQYMGPITITRDNTKQNSDAMFSRQLMAYKCPAARKIDKDIKIFRWSMVSEAIIKVSKNFVPSVSSIVLHYGQ